MHIHCVWELFHRILQFIIHKKTGLHGYVYGFSVDYDYIDDDDDDDDDDDNDVLDIIKH